MVAAVRKQYEGMLIVGGGIRTPDAAGEIASAGADMIVVGTMIEKDGNWQQKFASIVKSIRSR
jgi:phosphoglycerol geranylgeranyltransferase